MFQGLLNVNKDVFYALPTLEMVNALTSASPTTDVFVYLFDHYPQVNIISDYRTLEVLLK